MYNKEQLKDLIIDFIKEKKVKEIREIFEEYNIVDLADIFSTLSIDEAIFVFRILPKAISAELFSYLDNTKQHKLVEILSSKEVSNILDNMFSDDIIEFLEEMPANVIKKILINSPAERRKEINTLLSYSEYSASSIMSTDFVELLDTQTVEEAIIKIKKEAKFAETINRCFVIDKHRNYLGMVQLRDIIISKNSTLIGELVSDKDIFVNTNTDQEDVAKMIKKYDVTCVAVLNDQNRLIGIITADDILDVLVEEATEDIHRMGGVLDVEGSYVQTSIKEMVKSRLPWLLILMISGSFTGLILQAYEDKLSAIAILAASIPVIMGTSGNAGSQSSATIIRGIAVEDLNFKQHFLTIIFKELSVSFICGIIIFIANFIRIILLPSTNGNYLVALVVSLAIVTSLFIANILGGVLPLLATLLKSDPASMSAPLITTVADATSLIVYFSLATYFLKI